MCEEFDQGGIVNRAFTPCVSQGNDRLQAAKRAMRRSRPEWPHRHRHLFPSKDEKHELRDRPEDRRFARPDVVVASSAIGLGLLLPFF